MEAMMKMQAQKSKNQSTKHIVAFETKGDQLGFCPKGKINKQRNKQRNKDTIWLVIEETRMMVVLWINPAVFQHHLDCPTKIYPTSRDHLEKLIATGTENMCFL